MEGPFAKVDVKEKNIIFIGGGLQVQRTIVDTVLLIHLV